VVLGGNPAKSIDDVEKVETVFKDDAPRLARIEATQVPGTDVWGGQIR
jgi:hypothetical protein